MYTKFKIKTTVDITNHNKVYKEDKIAYGQKQNFMTVLNTIGLRVNPTVESNPALANDHAPFSKNSKVWEWGFSVEFEGAINIEMLIEDFSLVPIIDQLTENTEFKHNVFNTRGNNKNIVFTLDDK
jgi:hypothetical protein|tara:strand:- start:81 stop:458 length:378 start_codon:yes stop_codon:yes gene_type:complete